MRPKAVQGEETEKLWLLFCTKLHDRPLTLQTCWYLMFSQHNTNRCGHQNCFEPVSDAGEKTSFLSISYRSCRVLSIHQPSIIYYFFFYVKKPSEDSPQLYSNSRKLQLICLCRLSGCRLASRDQRGEYITITLFMVRGTNSHAVFK